MEDVKNKPELSNTHCALHPPRLALASCVRAYVSRSTIGANLRTEQRLNHFAAHPLCSLCWHIEGECILLSIGTETYDEKMPRITLGGPLSAHMVTANPGPVRAFIVTLFPDALYQLTGIDMTTLTNRIGPLNKWLDTDWCAMTQMVLAAPTDAHRIQIIEEFLEPRWEAVRSRGHGGHVPLLQRTRDWVEYLAFRAASSGVGRSIRQVERRVKNWAGLPMRDLRRLARGEESFLMARQTTTGRPRPLADVAAVNGFADQAHLSREIRRITGMPPAEFLRAMRSEESFWIYRIWN